MLDSTLEKVLRDCIRAAKEAENDFFQVTVQNDDPLREHLEELCNKNFIKRISDWTGVVKLAAIFRLESLAYTYEENKATEQALLMVTRQILDEKTNNNCNDISANSVECNVKQSKETKSSRIKWILTVSGVVISVLSLIATFFFGINAARDNSETISITELLRYIDAQSETQDVNQNSLSTGPVFIPFDIFDNSTWALSTIAAIEEEEIFLLGGLSERGVFLNYKSQTVYFHDWGWFSPRYGTAPVLCYRDFSGDGNNELGVILSSGTGTGLARFDLHLVTIGKNQDSGNYEFDVYSLHAHEVSTWLEMPLQFEFFDNGEAIFFDFDGRQYVVDKLYGIPICNNIHYSSIVIFEFCEYGISVTIGIGVYDQGIIPVYVGEIRAKVLFDGKNFTLTDKNFYLL